MNLQFPQNQSKHRLNEWNNGTKQFLAHQSYHNPHQYHNQSSNTFNTGQVPNATHPHPLQSTYLPQPLNVPSLTSNVPYGSNLSQQSSNSSASQSDIYSINDTVKFNNGITVPYASSGSSSKTNMPHASNWLSQSSSSSASPSDSYSINDTVELNDGITVPYQQVDYASRSLNYSSSYYGNNNHGYLLPTDSAFQTQFKTDDSHLSKLQSYCYKPYEKTSHHTKQHLSVERPFSCKWFNCGKRFSRSSLLNRHFKIHSGERKFTCSICAKKFKRSDHLSQHLKIHTRNVQNQPPHILFTNYPSLSQTANCANQVYNSQ